MFEAMRRVRRWVVWLGGWESPTRGWDFTYGPTPVSLFGNFVTFFGGGWFEFRFRRGWVVVFLPGSHRRSVPQCHAYWSPNGTPGHDRARLLIGNRAKWAAYR